MRGAISELGRASGTALRISEDFELSASIKETSEYLCASGLMAEDLHLVFAPRTTDRGERNNGNPLREVQLLRQICSCIELFYQVIYLRLVPSEVIQSILLAFELHVAHDEIFAHKPVDALLEHIGANNRHRIKPHSDLVKDVLRSVADVRNPFVRRRL